MTVSELVRLLTLLPADCQSLDVFVGDGPIFPPARVVDVQPPTLCGCDPGWVVLRSTLPTLPPPYGAAVVRNAPGDGE